MKKEQDGHGEPIASLRDGRLEIDLSGIAGTRLMAIVVGREQSLLDSGRYFVELDAGRIHRLSLAENPPPGQYTVVVLDPEAPRSTPRVSLIQIREIRD